MRRFLLYRRCDEERRSRKADRWRMIRLSGAQITRIEEFLYHYEQTHEPNKLATELLVEQILQEVLPTCPTNTPQIPNEQQSVSI